MRASEQITRENCQGWIQYLAVAKLAGHNGHTPYVVPCLLCKRYTLDATYDISAPGQERRRSQSIVLSETIKVGSEKSDMPKMYTEMFDAALSRMVSFGAGRAFASHKTCTAL